MNTTIELLKAARVGFGLDQAEMATLAGVSRRSITRMENGQDRSWNTFIAVQEALEKRGVEFLPKQEGLGYAIRMPANWEGSTPSSQRSQTTE